MANAKNRLSLINQHINSNSTMDGKFNPFFWSGFETNQANLNPLLLNLFSPFNSKI